MKLTAVLYREPRSRQSTWHLTETKEMLH